MWPHATQFMDVSQRVLVKGVPLYIPVSAKQVSNRLTATVRHRPPNEHDANKLGLVSEAVTEAVKN